MIAHFDIPKSTPIHLQNLSSLFIYICSIESLFVMAFRSSTYVAKLIVLLEVPKCIHFFSCCYLNSDSRKMINR